MKVGPALALLLLSGCMSWPRGPAPAADSSVPAQSRPADRPDPPVRPLQPDDESAAERAFEAARGGAALQRVRTAPTSVVALLHQGLPRPIAGPDGRTTFAGPAVNAVMREDGRWFGWKSGRAEAIPAALGARLDAILSDPETWREPDDFPSGGCTDAGSLQLTIRHHGRLKRSRQDNCRLRGLAGELGRIVIEEAGGPI